MHATNIDGIQIQPQYNPRQVSRGISRKYVSILNSACHVKCVCLTDPQSLHVQRRTEQVRRAHHTLGSYLRVNYRVSAMDTLVYVFKRS